MARTTDEQSQYAHWSGDDGDCTFKQRVVRVAVVGSRTFRNYRLLCNTLDALRHELGVDAGVTASPPTVLMRLVSGGAQGADRMAERYAAENALDIDVHRPDWRPNGVYDPGAGLKRNGDIVAQADLVVAFWDGISTGTRDTMRKAEKAGVEVRTIRF
jgi:hypothetical protein